MILLIPKALYAQCLESEILNLRRTAIVFGEKNYKNVSALNNPLNDASDISDSLKKVGFEVVTYKDADKKTMDAAIDDWCSKANKYDVALFYYSGHGAEYNGENFIFPIDANPKGPSDLQYQAVSATQLLNRLVSINPKFTIMILDACRNNPFTKSWVRGFGKEGLAVMTGKGAFIGYAATPGYTASDGAGRNGTYTEAILNNIMKPNLTIDQIFTRVNKDVRLKTSDGQIPFKSSSFSSDYCFSVTRTSKNPGNAKREFFFQPSSSLTTIRNNGEFFAIDYLTGGIVTKDANTLNNLPALPRLVAKPTQIVARNGYNLYIIDSTNKTLEIFDSRKKILLNRISLKNSPIHITVTTDESKAFISNSEGIDVVDLVNKKLLKTVPLLSKPSGIVISSDGKYLYTSTYANGENNALKIIDTRNYKVVKSIPKIAIGRTIAITPDNKKLYLGDYSENRNQVIIYDLSNLKILETLFIKANEFAFSYDSKYAFVLDDTNMFVLDNNTNEIIKKLPFVTKPKGIAVESNGDIFVWLPYESLLFTSHIDKNLVKKDFYDREMVLNKFIEESKKDVSRKDYDKVQAIVDQSKGLFGNVIEELKKRIGDKYKREASGMIPLTFIGGDRTKKTSFTFIDGVTKIDNRAKSIIPTLTINIKENAVWFSLFDNLIDKDEALYKSSLTQIEWSKVQSFFRDYFIDRINHLK